MKGFVLCARLRLEAVLVMEQARQLHAATEPYPCHAGVMQKLCHVPGVAEPEASHATATMQRKAPDVLVGVSKISGGTWS